jgi:CRP-like cAMP-binding protein
MNQSMTRFVEMLSARTRLTAIERQAITSLPGMTQHLTGGENIVRFGEPMTSACLVVQGFCGRVEMASGGKRQITAVYLAGDMPDLYSAFQPTSNSTMEALTKATVFRIPHRELGDVMRRYPAITEAFTRYLVGDAAITMEWVTNVGAREAVSRIAHLYCEIAVRLGQSIGQRFSFYFPILQSQLAEITGLSAVHVNRCLMTLRSERVMSIERRMVNVLDWNRLVEMGDFDPGYLTAPAPQRFANWDPEGQVLTEQSGKKDGIGITATPFFVADPPVNS